MEPFIDRYGQVDFGNKSFARELFGDGHFGAFGVKLRSDFRKAKTVGNLLLLLDKLNQPPTYLILQSLSEVSVDEAYREFGVTVNFAIGASREG